MKRTEPTPSRVSGLIGARQNHKHWADLFIRHPHDRRRRYSASRPHRRAQLRARGRCFSKCNSLARADCSRRPARSLPR